MLENLPTVVVAGKAFGDEVRRHLQRAKGTPVPNLPLKLIDRFGLPVEQFGEQR